LSAIRDRLAIPLRLDIGLRCAARPRRRRVSRLSIRWAVLAGAVLMSGLAPRPAHAGQLLRIRTWPWDDRYRIVLDLTEKTTHVDRVVTDPHRISINLRNTDAAGVVIPQIRDWMVEGIRLNRLPDGTAQVVIDLTAASSYKLFDLAPDGEKPHRVVCDILRPLQPPPTPQERPNWVVVIDPGHGGRDPGVVHRRMFEKAITLDVAQRLVERLAREPGIEAHLTRRADVFVGLAERARRAERVRADLFVSIHVNGFRTDAPRGAEVFFLSMQGATAVAERELEALENAAASEVSDPVLGEIADLPFAVDLRKTDTLRRSSLLAEAILDRFVAGNLAASRGVKQANFVVLRSCRVPSALVELGFASNAQDARQLAMDTHRQALAEAMAEGILEFRARYARHSAAEAAGAVEPAEAAGPPEPAGKP
jgi:N-acetylmuramoyl-L-alanine amidase